jgi:hypothetical protein
MYCQSRHEYNLFQEKAGRRLHVGHSALGYRRPEMEVVPALRDGLYDDVDVLNALWDHAIRYALHNCGSMLGSADGTRHVQQQTAEQSQSRSSSGNPV